MALPAQSTSETAASRRLLRMLYLQRVSQRTINYQLHATRVQKQYSIIKYTEKKTAEALEYRDYQVFDARGNAATLRSNQREQARLRIILARLSPRVTRI